VTLSLPTPPDLLPATGDQRVQSLLARLAVALGPRTGHVVVTAATAQEACALMWRVETEIVAYRAFWVSGRTLDAAHILRVLATDEPMAESLLAAVRTLLVKARGVGRPVVIIVSDADAAAVHELEQLRFLAECTPEAPELLRLVLLGSPTLLETLRRPEARALATRISSLVAAPQETVSAPLPHTGHLMSESLALPAAGARRPRAWRIAASGLLGCAVAAALLPLFMPGDEPTPVSIAAEPATTPPATAAPPMVETPVESPAPPAAVVAPAPANPPPPRAIIHRPPGAAPRLRSLQVGAFRDLARATALRDQLARSFEWVMVTDVERDGVVLHRVRVEGLASQAAVDAALAELRRAGHRPILVRP
jgi:cell division septation protein DedD